MRDDSSRHEMFKLNSLFFNLNNVLCAYIIIMYNNKNRLILHVNAFLSSIFHQLREKYIFSLFL